MAADGAVALDPHQDRGGSRPNASPDGMDLLDHVLITKEYTALEPTAGAQRWFGVSPWQRKGRAGRSRHEGKMLMTRPRTTPSTAREITDWSAINPSREW